MIDAMIRGRLVADPERKLTRSFLLTLTAGT
jgi:hypothetical protein